jgi:serine/threonine-protein kinase HipA
VAKTVSAEVRLHGRRVGSLEYDRGGSAFRYEDDLTDRNHQTLGQIFEDDPRTLRRVRVGLPAWFANLLPEGELRRQVVRQLGGGNIGPFTILLRLGADLPGAVTVHSNAEPDDDVGVDNYVNGEPNHPLRHSLAGVQLKYSVHSDRLTFPASGDSAWWIMKLPDRSLTSLVVNEFVTMCWLHATGMNVPRVQLAPARAVGGIPEGLVDPGELVYLIERFDRTPTARVHVEDFAQVADVEPAFKYGDLHATHDGLAAVILNLTGIDGYLEYVRRLVAMLIVGNTDAHLKNWALIYPDGRSAALSPVYDFHSLTIYDRYRYTPLALSLNGEKGPDDLRRMAERCGADPEQTVATGLETIHRLRQAWDGGMRAEAEARFPALAAHFVRRLDTLPVSVSA